MRNDLIIGATSAMATAAAREWAAAGHRLFLVARNAEKLSALADDLRVRGAEAVETAALDVNEMGRHAAVLDEAAAFLGRIDRVLVAHGTLGDQKACERDPALALAQMQTNAVSTIALLTLLANRLEMQGAGTLAVISSVAGDRGRGSNYVYGAAKAAVNTFLQGLRNRLHASGVAVVTIKPGFVDTPMTAHLPKGPLWASPERAGRAIVRAIEHRQSVAYVPGYWRWIMLAVRAVPEAMFKRMSL